MNAQQQQLNAKCKQNIVLFEDQIRHERKTIRDYKAWIERSKYETIDFDPEALKRGIKAAEQKILTFEEAIDKEYATMNQHRQQLHQVDQRIKEIQHAVDNVKVEVITDDEEE